MQVLGTKFSFSLRFFVLSYILLALLATAFFFTQDLPRYRQEVSQTLNQVQQEFPNDAVLSWDKQKLTANTATPIELHYPPFFQTEDFPSTFGYIVASSSSLTEATKQASKSSLFVVTSKQLFIVSPSSGWSSFDLKEILTPDQSFTLSKQTLPHFIDLWKTDLNDLLTTLGYVYPIGIFLFYLVARTITLLLNSLLIFYVIQVFRKQLPFMKVWQISLHVSVVAEFVQIITSHLFLNLSLPMYSITYWTYILFILIGIFNLHTLLIRPRK